MHNFRKVAVRVCFVLAFVFLFEQGIRFLYEPWTLNVAASKRERTDLKGTLDTVYAGTSLAARGFSPVYIDEILGTSSFNVSTGSQPVKGSYYLIREAAEQNPVRRVYLGLSIASLKTDYTDYEYLSAYENLCTWKWRLRYLWSLKREPVLVSGLFYSTRVEYYAEPQVVKDNVENKLRGSKGPIYGYRGWSASRKRYKGDAEASGETNNKINYWDGEAGASQTVDEALEYIRKTGQFCRENGIEFYLVLMPVTQDYLELAGDIYDLDDFCRNLAQEAGAGYYNFMLYKDAASVFTDDLFKDYKHLNVYGAKEFAKIFAEVVSSEDPEKYFASGK